MGGGETTVINSSAIAAGRQVDLARNVDKNVQLKLKF